MGYIPLTLVFHSLVVPFKKAPSLPAFTGTKRRLLTVRDGAIRLFTKKPHRTKRKTGVLFSYPCSKEGFGPADKSIQEKNQSGKGERLARTISTGIRTGTPQAALVTVIHEARMLPAFSDRGRDTTNCPSIIFTMRKK